MERKEKQALTEYEDIINNLIELVERKKLKKGAIAAKLGLSSQQFSDILHGRKLLRIEDVPLMAEALEVDIADIFSAKKVKGKVKPMLVVELKKLLADMPDNLEVVTETLEADMSKSSCIYRNRIVGVDIEETPSISPVLCPEFKGKQVVTLRIVNRR